MRILLCSDIHDDFELFPVAAFPEADLCLVAGDLTNYGLRGRQKLSSEDLLSMRQASAPAEVIEMWQADEITRAADWLKVLAARFPVCWIPGNHDIGVTNDTFGEIHNCTGILNRTVEVQGLRLHGVSMAPCYDAPMLAELWDYMTADMSVEAAHYDFEPVDIVVSHAPPYGHGDLVGPLIGDGDKRHIGSVYLLEYIRRYTPKLVVCGHVHEGSGQSEVETDRGRTPVYNVARRWQLVEV
jgi:Icc-related predicted phosphoesterase